MKRGSWLFFPFLLRLLFILILYAKNKLVFISQVKFNMHRMFTAALEQLLQKELAMGRDTKNLAKNIIIKYKYDITYTKFARLPHNQLQNAMKIPCPTLEKTDDSSQIVIFKRLRHYFNISEESVCLKCTRNCPFRNLDFKQMPNKASTNNKSGLHDLLFYLISLSHHDEAQYSSLRWASAYKSILALQIFMKEVSSLSKQALLFRQVLKYYQNEEKKHLQSKSKVKDEEAETKKLLQARKIIL